MRIGKFTKLCAFVGMVGRNIARSRFRLMEMRHGDAGRQQKERQISQNRRTAVVTLENTPRGILTEIWEIADTAVRINGGSGRFAVARSSNRTEFTPYRGAAPPPPQSSGIQPKPRRTPTASP